jgi:hypothetical protein
VLVILIFVYFLTKVKIYLKKFEQQGVSGFTVNCVSLNLASGLALGSRL